MTKQPLIINFLSSKDMKYKSKSEGHKKIPSRFNYKNFHQKSLFLDVNFLRNLISNEKEKQMNKKRKKFLKVEMKAGNKIIIQLCNELEIRSIRDNNNNK